MTNESKAQREKAKIKIEDVVVRLNLFRNMECAKRSFTN
jgi:hypothetical protein